MSKIELVIFKNYPEESLLTLEDICEICHVSADFVHALISEEIIMPEHLGPSGFLFNLAQLQRVRTALRLQEDLEINLSGIALVMSLLDERDRLRKKAEFIEKHYLNYEKLFKF